MKRFEVTHVSTMEFDVEETLAASFLIIEFAVSKGESIELKIPAEVLPNVLSAMIDAHAHLFGAQPN